MRMIQKEYYTSPEVDVFTVLPEGVICQSGPWGDPNAPGPGLTEDPDYIYNF